MPSSALARGLKAVARALAPVVLLLIAVGPTASPVSASPEVASAAAAFATTVPPAAAFATTVPPATAFPAASGSEEPGPLSQGPIETPSTGVWPLRPSPEVVAGFDPPRSTYGAGHRGVDLLGAPEQKVHAAVGGRVTYAGLLAGRGVVVVSHGATRTTYQPVSAVVRRGDTVRLGQLLGTLQNSGSHCAPRVCLHWGLLEGERYLDPLSLVGGGPVRLLPLTGLTWPHSSGR